MKRVCNNRGSGQPKKEWYPWRAPFFRHNTGRPACQRIKRFRPFAALRTVPPAHSNLSLALPASIVCHVPDYPATFFGAIFVGPDGQPVIHSGSWTPAVESPSWVRSAVDSAGEFSLAFRRLVELKRVPWPVHRACA